MVDIAIRIIIAVRPPARPLIRPALIELGVSGPVPLFCRSRHDTDEVAVPDIDVKIVVQLIFSG
jgi:hypothetical protein